MTRRCDGQKGWNFAPGCWPAGNGSVDVLIVGLKFHVDLLNAQKTGFYLDQVPHYSAVAHQATGKRVLDCFTSQGAFALACARAGAASVSAVEASAESLAAARQNAEQNGLMVNWIEQDVFDFLRAAEKAEAQYDLIILDPPSFTKTKGGLHGAIRGYRELHVRAFKLLSKEGLLATFSCSHHVNEEAFTRMISDALVDARRSARRLATVRAGRGSSGVADAAGNRILQRRAA